MKRIALCIGNDAYSILPALNCAIADATAMEKELKDLGFDTELRTDLDRTGLADAIFSFADKIENYDAALIYYAGHGFQVDGDNILAPIELDIQARPELVKYNAFPLSELTEVLNRFPNQTKIVILDACREIIGHRGAIKDFAPISAPQGSVIAFATSPGQSSKENVGTGHGYYTEALLKYMSLPRMPIETTFKKVREFLFAKTSGKQIPWEHTSLVGEFYFNPDTIYDGAAYSLEAYSDNRFRFSTDSKIKGIVDGLKSHSWPQQEPAVRSVNGIDFQTASGNELFVLGRNIYQAADGNCYACHRFIDGFSENSKIPTQAKLHILNGMAYEIYFDSSNKIRNLFKLGYYQKIIDYLEQAEFYGSRDFIAAKLSSVSDRPIYIPGQNEAMEFVIQTHSEDMDRCVDDITYHGKSVFYDEEGVEKPKTMDFPKKTTSYRLMQEIAGKVATPIDRIKLQYDTELGADASVIIPQYGFEIKF